MIETTIPEINVLELMERVRAKASEIGEVQRSRDAAEAARTESVLSAIRPLPPLALPKPAPPRKDRVLALVERARRNIQVKPWIPKLLRRFFRKQEGYNSAVLESVAVLAKAHGELASRLEQLTACLDVQNQWFSEDRTSFQGRSQAIGRRLDRLDDTLHRDLRSVKDDVIGNFAALRTELLQNGEQLVKLRSDIDRFDGKLADLQKDAARNAEELRAEILSDFQALRSDAEHAGEHLRNLQHAVTQGAAHVSAVTQRLDTLVTDVADVARNNEQLIADSAFLRGQLTQHDLLLRQPSPPMALSGSKIEEVAATPSQPSAWDKRFDAFYLRFEDQFRGSRDEIKERISFYLPFIWDTGPGTASYPILDLGCGRGEWLELLRDIGVEAQGVDINSAMLAMCQERGLSATEGDALEYLRSLPNDSQRAITGFHIIEHLPFGMLMDVFAEAYRVVRPGGRVIFESPNCKNLIVGACNFNVDPTHRNPVFPDTAKFILETKGFQPVEIEYLTPIPNSPIDDISPALHELLYGPQDFAVIGFKPATV